MGSRTVFLDRDGVINVDRGYVGSWEDFEYLPGAIEGLRLLCDRGFKLVVVTNQSGIARGYYSEANFQLLTSLMRQDLAEKGIELAAVYYCPHLPQAKVMQYREICDCRKPKPGMFIKAAAELGIDLRSSVMIGDKSSDMQAAEAAGISERYLIDITARFKNSGVMGDSLKRVAELLTRATRSV